GILNPACLPIPPLRQRTVAIIAICKEVIFHFKN
ncbi:MAG: hypothetical protein ACI89T_002537, partial [Cognaticolwellia sp.]